MTLEVESEPEADLEDEGKKPKPAGKRKGKEEATPNGMNGNGGDHGNGQNGHDALVANGKRTMQIVFRPSGDLDRDKYRLKQIVDTVRDPKGRDQFLIVIKGHGKTTTLAFPDDPCSISDRLRSELSKFFRVDVQVKE
jgi:hypothetical protein